MNKLYFFLVSFFLLNISIYSQLADHIVIAEVYPGGGNSGAYYKYDYIVLYNPTSSSVDLSTWSIQYAGATNDGSRWQVTKLTGTIYSKSYFAIQENGDTAGVNLPFTPNVVDSTQLATAGGKVALLNSQTKLTVQNPIGSSDVVDFIGYGNANAYDTSPALKLSNNSQSLRRLDNAGNATYGVNGNGWDSENDSLDFIRVKLDGTNPPLPVELSSFSASTIEKKIVQLKWNTETEINNYGFEVQRSKYTNKDWKTLGFVSGHGTSNSKQSYVFVDNNILSSGIYFYRLKQIDQDGTNTYSNAILINFGFPSKYEVFQNYPNPFNPSTIIEYNIPEECYVDIDIFDSQGTKVSDLVTKNHPAGNYKVSFNGGGLSSGVYFCRIQAKGKTKTFSSTKKMILLR